MKLYFEGMAFLWAFIPIYGYIKAMELRARWAMASNVVIFEKLTGYPGIERCTQLVDLFPEGMFVRTLVTIPTIVIILLLTLTVIAATIFETSFPFWIFLFVFLFIVFPLSGSVNTHLYLIIPGIKDNLEL